jgi:chromosomal replication initiator protein
LWITLWITGRIEKEMQREELDEFLEKTKELLKGEVTKISYETWIKDLELQSMDNNTIILVAHTQFQKDSIMSRYYELFKNTFKYLTNKEWDITVILNEDNEDEQESSISQVGQYTQTLNSNLNPKYTFESFVVGNNNRFAHAAALAVAEAPLPHHIIHFFYMVALVWAKLI